MEVPSAIWRKHREGGLSQEDGAVLIHALEADWHVAQRYAIVEVTDDLLDHAARLVARHSLRAMDAVQLSSAVAAQSADPSVAELVCFDGDLAAAARVEGLRVIP